jgi:ribosomal protein S18 acetylase RimI-like enzyme
MPSAPPELTPLGLTERAALIGWLGDSPYTALSAGQVKAGLCRTYAIGDAGAPSIALVHSAAEPGELAAFGTEVGSLWSLLSRLPGWTSVNVEADLAAAVAALLGQRLGLPARILTERYYVLERDPGISSDTRVRRLGTADGELVRRSNPAFRPFFVGHGDIERTLEEGVVAGALSAGTLLSAVTTSAWARRHVDLGAVTDVAWRGRGLATECARTVASELRAAGLRPVWAAGESNPASWRIPEKLGFTFVGRRAYVVFDGLEPEGFRPG